ncbi:unnamed protein product [Acanthoscelides obtectus]|uniref:Uncharacterized protein n=1 Tax=Acanthoscelides obtectus TaxID=200917 RepID=A0A9P0P0Y5_ACAOB|nr:unnamed protein product [Acanthoscelides obtectus]CAK1646726.1 hypothetical protein AOBTE_LOCUS14845 [Acanthoscelides obtectus]
MTSFVNGNIYRIRRANMSNSRIFFCLRSYFRNEL